MKQLIELVNTKNGTVREAIQLSDTKKYIKVLFEDKEIKLNKLSSGSVGNKKVSYNYYDKTTDDKGKGVISNKVITKKEGVKNENNNINLKGKNKMKKEITVNRDNKALKDIKTKDIKVIKIYNEKNVKCKEYKTVSNAFKYLENNISYGYVVEYTKEYNQALKKEIKFNEKITAIDTELIALNEEYTTVNEIDTKIETNKAVNKANNHENKNLIILAMQKISKEYREIKENNPKFNRVQIINQIKGSYKDVKNNDLIDIVTEIKALNVNIDLHLPKGTITYIIKHINAGNISKSMVSNRDALTAKITALREIDKVINAKKILEGK